MPGCTLCCRVRAQTGVGIARIDDKRTFNLDCQSAARTDAGAASRIDHEERQQAWQEAFRIVHEDLIADIMMVYMVGYTRVGPRVDFTPSISTNSELQVAHVKFKQ
ncbi:MAG: hypothetical protein ACREJ5_05415 [Geminicoccaceae bacterium]